jgi:hypothetical protein
MSYILDALKKAERDRLREDPKELDDFASSNWDPYYQPSKSDFPKYLFFLVCAIIVLGSWVIYSGITNLPQPEQSPEVATTAPPAMEPVESPMKIEQPPSLPDLQISGHMFIADGSASNRLFANGRSFREGDMLDTQWRLVAIGVESFSISAGQRRETLMYR